MKRLRIKRNQEKFFRFVASTPPEDVLSFGGEPLATDETIEDVIIKQITKKIEETPFSIFT